MRTQISPRTRFEVFKRDKFTCQYCGRAAPEVVLQADHIHPVAEGGANDLLNLVTSCSTCNGGKGAIKLSDDSAVAKQQRMLSELEDRRQQIEMMLQWRDELQNAAKDAVESLCDRIKARSGFGPNETGKTSLRKWIKTYSFQEVLNGIDEAFDTYAEYNDEKITDESWEKAFGKIPGIIRIIREQADKPYMRRIFYIQGIVRNRIRKPHFDCFDYLEHVHLAGESLEDLEAQAKRIRHFGALEGYYRNWLDQIGRPF